jgi:VanZ family protein
MRHWWPALLWAGLIACFSTDLFSWEHTSRVILPLLLRLFPTTPLESLLAVHHYIRKSAHVFEYFVLSLLLLRALRGGQDGWKWQWAVTALLTAAGWAALDEIHQAFVPSRGPSMFDVLIDVCGAAAAQLFCAALALFRAPPTGASQEASAATRRPEPLGHPAGRDRALPPRSRS